VLGGFFLAGVAVRRSNSRSFKGCPDVATGSAKWFNEAKGYGFIIPDEGGADIFVHATEVKKSGYSFLPNGARVSFDLVPGRDSKMSAENLRIS